MDLPAAQMDEKQHVICHQPCLRPDLSGEEIRRDEHLRSYGFLYEGVWAIGRGKSRSGAGGGGSINAGEEMHLSFFTLRAHLRAGYNEIIHELTSMRLPHELANTASLPIPEHA
jgi:hypothetical protein